MKKIAIIAVIMITIFSISSCEKEFIETSNEQKINVDLSLKDGRMFFQNKDALTRIYKQYADATDEKLSKFLEPMYKNGFYSLRPAVTEANESFIFEHYKKILKTSNQSRSTDENIFDYLDDFEDIIGDETFAAFLNSNGEIQVADEIYKYTDVGLFYANEDKLNILKNYLVQKNISLDLTVGTNITDKQAILTEFPSDGTSIVNNDITYYKMLPPDYDNGGGGGGGSGGGSYTPPTYSNFPAFSASLQNCDYGGFWHSLTSFFGDHYRCIDKYENRRRVKTKGFNYDFFLVFHVGVKVVHQYKGLTGIWRQEDTDEIKLAVEAVQFEYDTNAMLNNALINNYNQERAFYINNQRILYQPNVINTGSFTYTGLNHSALPQIFQNDGLGLTFEMFATGSPFLDNLIQNGINSSLNAGRLNNLFWNQLYSQSTTILRTALNNASFVMPDNRTFVAKFPENGKLIVQKSVSKSGFNTSVKQQTFDWGAEIRLVSNEGNGSWNISATQGNQIMRPKNFRVKMIGAARRGGLWHGSKLSMGID